MKQTVEQSSLKDKRICANCNSHHSYICKSGYELWRRHKDNWYCSKCYCKLFGNPRYSPISNARRTKEVISRANKKKIKFLGKHIYLADNPRKGQCSKCGKKIGDEFVDYWGKTHVITSTHMHHWFYLIIMPWACTEELCESCHGKEGWKLGQNSWAKSK